MTHTKNYDNHNKLLKVGGLIIRNNDGLKEVLLIDSNSRGWSFPKGHLENDETIKEGAVRECKEETGLDLKIVKKLPSLEYRNQITGDNIIVNFYQMKVIGGQLQKEYKSDDLRWVSLEKAAGLFDYQNLKDYMELVKGLID